MMQQQEDTGFVETILPWIVAGSALLVYLLTLNHWLNLANLATVAKVTGWDWWSVTLQAPLLYVITRPFQWLPVAWQPVALNALSAVCSAATLGLLAYSVALLPHDRTRDQRQREHSDYSLLTIPAAWVPPVLAAAACGLQLTFWENATAITGESLNLLLFAYIVRCLLEYRLDQNDAWLTRSVFVYGLAVTNTWEVLGYFPALLIAIIWIKGMGFFNQKFLLRLAGYGLAGLLPYLLLPLLETGAGRTSLSFWQMLKYELATQKNILLLLPKTRILLCSLTSLLPVLIMSIRWPSFLGDTSVIGGLVGQAAFRIVHALFLAIGLWVMFDPPFSPRALGMGLPFLTLYYLTALSIGYFSGYFLLVFGSDSDKSRRRRSPAVRVLHRALTGVVWAVLIAVPVALAFKNAPVVQANDGKLLANLGTALTESLPPHDAIVLSDDPFCLMLAEAAQGAQRTRSQHVYVDTRSLQYHVYQRILARRYPQRWPNWLDGQRVPDPIDSPTLLQQLVALSRTNEIYYLHPSFGFYFEAFYPKHRGLVYQLLPYPPSVVKAPPPSPQEVLTNQAFWSQLRSELSVLLRNVDTNRKDVNLADVDYATHFYSRAANTWGVELQRNGWKAEAGPWFEMARELNPQNVSALMNLKSREKPTSAPARELEQSIQDLLKHYRAWDDLERENGPIDDAKTCMALGQLLARNNIRQAAQEFLRVRELDPDNMDARVWLADIYLRGQWPERALEEIQQARLRPATQPLSSTNLIELCRLEAWCHFAMTNLNTALQVLEAAQKQYPKEPSLPKTRYDILLLSRRFSDALTAIDQQLQLDPTSASALLNKSALLIQLKECEKAVPILDQLLQMQPRNEAAHMNRAIAYLQSGKLDAAEVDYKALLNLQPKSYVAYYGLGEVADRRKDSANAIKNYRLFLKFAPPDIEEIKRVTERLKVLESGKSGG